jgi:hypothetical protein
MAQQQIQKKRSRKAIEQAPTGAVNVYVGSEILPAKTSPARSIFTPPANIGFTFGRPDASDWQVALRTWQTDVDKLIHECDRELDRLGCLIQRDRDALLARYIPAALPTAEYSVVTEQVA